MTNKIKVENPGILTTVQDKGRWGYQKYGMPVAGAMDNYALEVANIMVGNARNEAVLEMTYPGIELDFEGNFMAALTGGDLGGILNGKKLLPWQSFEVSDGDRLNLTTMKKGSRAYLSVEGGLDVPKIFDSKSTYLRGKIGGFKGRQLQKGDIIEIGNPKKRWKAGAFYIIEDYKPDYDRRNIRVIMGPQDDQFSKKEIEKFLNSKYEISNKYDRMGYRLEGPPIKHKKGPDIISDGIGMGAIQIPGHGKPIIMLADRQTTGGYTKIANVISVDLPILAQLTPGDKIKFERITMEKAHKLYLQKENKLAVLGEFFDYLHQSKH